MVLKDQLAIKISNILLFIEYIWCKHVLTSKNSHYSTTQLGRYSTTVHKIKPVNLHNNTDEPLYYFIQV